MLKVLEAIIRKKGGKEIVNFGHPGFDGCMEGFCHNNLRRINLEVFLHSF
jgi:hypothetical protein